MVALTLGADPEFFLRDKKTKKIVSAHDLIPGTKDKPFPMKGGGHIQADGTAVEFNIPPASTDKEFAHNIGVALKDIGDFVDRAKYEFVFEPSVTYDKDYWDSLPDNVKELGCTPDFNAYSKDPKTPNNHTIGLPEFTRTGSGHIHLGYTKCDNMNDTLFLEECRTVVSYLDNVFTCGEYFWCKDTIRPKSYGAMGTYRPKKYGLEYRMLSNAWLGNPDLWPWVFNAAKNVVDSLSTQLEIHKCHHYSDDTFYKLNSKIVPLRYKRDYVDFALRELRNRNLSLPASVLKGH